MTWRDNLRPASFRGVPFFVKSHDFNSGRKIIEHDLPEKDFPDVEDLGLAFKQYRLDAFVIGEDYFSQRNSLQEICEKPGEGILIHPYLGSKIVVCREFTLRESFDTGNMASFFLNFLEIAPAPIQEVKEVDDIAKARAEIEDITGKMDIDIDEDFEEDYSIADLPEFIADSARELLGFVSDKIELAKSAVKTVTDTVDQAQATFNGAVADLKLNSALIVQTGKDFISSVRAAITTVENISEIAKEIFDFHVGLFDFGDTFQSIDSTTLTRIQQAKNQQATIDLVKGLAVNGAAKKIKELSFNSQSESNEVRDDFILKIDSLLESTDNDKLYKDLLILKSIVFRLLPTNDKKLSKVTKLEFKSSLPALVIAYDFYEDSNKENDVIQQNQIRSPGFVNGEIEVLS